MYIVGKLVVTLTRKFWQTLATIVHVFVILISSTKIINTLSNTSHISLDNIDYYCVDAASMSIDSEGLSFPCVNTPKVYCHCTV